MSDYNGYNNEPSYYQEEKVTDSQVATYVAKVMGWMCVGLLTTFVTIMLCLASPRFLYFLYANPYMFYGIMVAELVVVIAMSAAIKKISAAAATVMFMVYAALTGVTMTTVILLFETASIMTVFLLTAGIFLTMALVGFVTKKDLTRIGSLALFGLIGIIVAGIVNMFLGNSMLDLAICAIGIVLFIGLTAYDTQRIKGFYVSAMEGGYTEDSELVKKASIFGALTLYLDFINLFLKLLRLVGRRRN